MHFKEYSKFNVHMPQCKVVVDLRCDGENKEITKFVEIREWFWKRRKI